MTQHYLGPTTGSFAVVAGVVAAMLIGPPAYGGHVVQPTTPESGVHLVMPTMDGERGKEVFVSKGCAGERLRLRLANVANARTFAPRFGAATQAWLIALDGQPLPPRRLPDRRVVLGAGMRADLILDLTGAPGTVK